jgi:serine/threonine-protein kinase HipA
MIRRLEVLLHQHRVGELIERESNASFEFVLDDAYASAGSRDVLGQFFEDHRFESRFLSRDNAQLPYWFANLLPEGAVLQLLHMQIDRRDDASGLARLGEDLPGAVVVRPMEGFDAELTRPSVRSVAPEPTEVQTVPLRWSLAGVQLKFSVAQEDSGRFTLPMKGMGGNWIVKFDSERYPDLVRNEFFTMQWAAAMGLNVPEIQWVPRETLSGIDQRILDLGDHVFAIRRFDRGHAVERIHIEDFCQVFDLPAIKKYEKASYDRILRLVHDTCGTADAIEMLRRVVFSLLVGNVDHHLKNISLMYPNRQSARLSPAYDMLFVRQYLEDDDFNLTLSSQRRLSKLRWKHLQQMEVYLHKYHVLIDVIDKARALKSAFLDYWQTHRNIAPERYRAAMETHLQQLPLITTDP